MSDALGSVPTQSTLPIIQTTATSHEQPISQSAFIAAILTLMKSIIVVGNLMIAGTNLSGADNNLLRTQNSIMAQQGNIAFTPDKTSHNTGTILSIQEQNQSQQQLNAQCSALFTQAQQVANIHASNLSSQGQTESSYINQFNGLLSSLKTLTSQLNGANVS